MCANEFLHEVRMFDNNYETRLSRDKQQMCVHYRRHCFVSASDKYEY